MWFKSPVYLHAASKLPPEERPALLMFGLNVYGGLDDVAVYDESDEVMKPAGERSEAWKKRADYLRSCGILGGIPAGGHFYIIELGC